MANTFQRSDGDIAQVMQTMLASPEFAQAQPRKFKDPNRFVVSAMRVAYEDQPVINAAPMASWVQQLGEPLFGVSRPMAGRCSRRPGPAPGNWRAGSRWRAQSAADRSNCFVWMVITTRRFRR